MDSSTKQNTNIQEQPNKQPELVPTKVGTILKKLGLYLDFISNRLELATLKSKFDWQTFTRTIFFVVSTLLVVSGILYWKLYLSAMNTKSLSDGGYNYSFIFSKPAKLGTYSNGMRGYATDEDHSAVIGPISGLSELCGSQGDPYTLAFTVTVSGTTRPVCTAKDAQAEQMFMMTFTAQNEYHEFLVTYGYANDAKLYPKLKAIFESVSVTR